VDHFADCNDIEARQAKFLWRLFAGCDCVLYFLVAHSQELHTLQLGKRAFRRYLNEKLLRELAGPLDAEQMAMLYAPPPFGEVQATVLARITEASADNEAARAWEPFRQVDMDLQVRTSAWRPLFRSSRSWTPCFST
jgi:hypothetical protein